MRETLAYVVMMSCTIVLILVMFGLFGIASNLEYLRTSFDEGKVCYIAMSPEDYLKENQKLINFKAQELSKRRCGK